MIFRLLTNANYLIYFFCIFVILILLTYLIYKVFIVENDLFILNEKINRFEIEFNNPNSSLGSSSCVKENFNLSDIIMNEVFNSKPCNSNGVCKMSFNKPEEVANEIDIDIDNIIDKTDIIEVVEEKTKDENLFDLKKEIVVDDVESSVVSENNTKRKLQKLNLDKLKEKCAELNLSTEGTKAQLVNRILEES
jgi:hypothetical protein